MSLHQTIFIAVLDREVHGLNTYLLSFSCHICNCAHTQSFSSWRHQQSADHCLVNLQCRIYIIGCVSDILDSVG